VRVTIAYHGVPVAEGELEGEGVDWSGELRPLAGWPLVREIVATGWASIGNYGILGPAADPRSMEAGEAAVERLFALAQELDVLDARATRLGASEVMLTERPEPQNDVVAWVTFEEEPAAVPAERAPARGHGADASRPAV
jgi:hypothetical protein